MKLPWWKKLTFAGVSVALFFASLEGVLYLCGVRPLVDTRDPFVGFAERLPLFVETAGADANVTLVTAQNKLPFFNRQSFSRRKPDGVFRVFCLGGSTTYGRPYNDSTSFCGFLRAYLPLADGSRRYEVINAGGISYASYRAAAVMEELTAYDADLFIVYTGHNEFLEERTYGDLKSKPGALLEIAAWLTRTRTYSWIHSCFEQRPDDETSGNDGRFVMPAEVDAALDLTVGPSSYHRDDRLRVRILEHFKFNLRRMAQIAEDSGAKILFVTPASNLKDCSPFKSENGVQDELLDVWRRHFELGTELSKADEWNAAAESFQRAAAADPRHAETHYRLGRALLKCGRYEAAGIAFRNARDEDVCPLRAPTEFVFAARLSAGETEALLVDFEVQLGHAQHRKSGHSIVGREFLLDHVHPTVDAHAMLAKAIVEELLFAGVLSPSRSWTDANIAQATRRIKAGVSKRDHALALRNLAKVLSWAGKFDEAGPLAVRAADELTDDAESQFMAAKYLKQADRGREAVEYYRRAIRHQHFTAEEHRTIADGLSEDGEFAEGEAHYEEAARLDRGDP